MITSITKTHKDQLNYLNKTSLDEIKILKKQNDELKEKLDKNKICLDKTEAELNKEKSLKKSLTEELSNVITMHEQEVSMRLKFESKLNNLSSM